MGVRSVLPSDINRARLLSDDYPIRLSRGLSGQQLYRDLFTVRPPDIGLTTRNCEERGWTA